MYKNIQTNKQSNIQLLINNYICSDLALEAQQRVDWRQKADSNYLDHKTINYTTK